MMFIKQGDRRPVASATIKHGLVVQPLTDAASVTFKMRLEGRLYETVVDAAAVIVDAANGMVEYRWAEGDTDGPGTHFADWEVIWNDGTPETFPTVNFDVIVIRPSLDGS